MAGLLNCFILLTMASTGIEAARVLAFFPTPSISHQIVFRPLTHELARRGHEVIVVTPDPVYPRGKTPANLTEIDVHDISYEHWKQLYTHHRGQKNDLLAHVKLLLKTFSTILDYQMQVPEIKEIMNKDRKYFDIMLLEACNRPLLAMAHKFDAPVIQLSSFGAVAIQYAFMGAPSHPILYPTPGRLRLYNLTFMEKAIELAAHMLMNFVIDTTKEYDNSIMRKHFGKDVPTYENLLSSVKMMFLNEHPFWADNHPVPPNIIYMGGIHLPTAKELPKDIKEYLDSSKHGVIYVSFGTNVLPSLLPPEKINVMTKVLSELPYDVLWKWDKDILPGQSKNINISKWFPQSDLLKHPKVKLFITQGGLQSTDEAIDATVPLIGIPMLGDQWYNVEKYSHHKIGMQFDINTLNEKEFKEAVTTVIHDKSYKNNMIRIKAIMRERPINPLNLTVWWTEHIIKYGGEHLKAPAANISWAQYYENLQEYLDFSKNGVIYVSFGTNVLASLLPPEKIKIMTKVLSELPYDVLWKWDKDILPGQSQNSNISKWFLQADLLRHPKIKLFIAQGGLQSTDETIDATVPLIGIPMLGDQWYNVEKYSHHKIGLQVNVNSLNEKELKEAINTVIHDKSYKNNIIRIKEIMKAYPIHPLNLTVWWTEHIIKYGGEHLKSPAAFISWVQYY